MPRDPDAALTPNGEPHMLNPNFQITLAAIRAAKLKERQ